MAVTSLVSIPYPLPHSETSRIYLNPLSPPLARGIIYGWPLTKLIKSYVLFHHILCALRYICTPSILQFFYLKRGENVSKIKYTTKKISLTKSVTRLIQKLIPFNTETQTNKIVKQACLKKKKNIKLNIKPVYRFHSIRIDR